MTISEMFSVHGEGYFRLIEKAAISRVARYNNAIIATGGGVVLFPDNMTRLRSNGIIIALTASLEVILERTGRRATRPLLERPDRVEYVAKLFAGAGALISGGKLLH